MRKTGQFALEPKEFFDRDMYAELEAIVESTNIVPMIDVNQNIISGTFTQKNEEIRNYQRF